jgi:hypothetical protein
VFDAFYERGPLLRFVSSRGGNVYPTFEDFQTATDGRGLNRGYLASESQFAVLKEYEASNRIVPLVGDFAGPKTLRAVGDYVRTHDARVSVFYTSNVERYLFQNGVWDEFLANVASLPMDDRSVFIRSCFDSCSSPGGSRAVTLLDSMSALVRDARSGRVTTYRDVLSHGQPR